MSVQPWHRRADAERQQKMIKLAEDYVNHIKECWVHASVSSPPRLTLVLKHTLSATHRTTRRPASVQCRPLQEFVHVLLALRPSLHAGTRF
jgi:hypothetical protein